MKLSDEQKLENEIIDKCAELERYDDDDYTPPAFVNELEGEEFESFWDWMQTLLKASARNAIDVWVESHKSSEPAWREEAEQMQGERNEWMKLCEYIGKTKGQAIEVLKNIADESDCKWSVDRARDFLSSLSHKEGKP